jgi:hypothetical protein
MNRPKTVFFITLSSVLICSAVGSQTVDTVPEEFPANPQIITYGTSGTPQGFDFKKYTKFPIQSAKNMSAQACFTEYLGSYHSHTINQNRSVVGFTAVANADFEIEDGSRYQSGSKISMCIDKETGLVFGSQVSGVAVAVPEIYNETAPFVK